MGRDGSIYQEKERRERNRERQGGEWRGAKRRREEDPGEFGVGIERKRGMVRCSVDTW